MAILALMAVDARADVIVENSCDSVRLWIGEQSKIYVSVTCNSDQRVDFPIISDTIIRNLEIVPPVVTDTQYVDHKKRMTVTRSYTVTSFDSALYYIRPFTVMVDSVPYSAESGMTLMVDMFEVDTLNVDSFFGPKEIFEMPLEWQDVSLSVYSLILLIILALGAVFLYMRWRDGKPIVRFVKKKPERPAHEVALEAFEDIRLKKLSHNDDPKQYYTELTDVLRLYVERRFGFNATEMTSDEIIGHLSDDGNREALNEMRELLQTADLAKFAKFKPLLGENDRNLMTAVDFVKNTTVVTDTTEEAEEEVEEIVSEAKRSREVGIAILVTAALMLCGSAVCLYVFVRELYYLLF